MSSSFSVKRSHYCDRYWISETYQGRHEAGQEPQNIDKEFLRLWFRDHCDPYNDKVSLAHHKFCNSFLPNFFQVTLARIAISACPVQAAF